MPRLRVGSTSGALAVLFAVLLSPLVSWADGAGSIDHAESQNGELRILYSIPELAAAASPDLASVQVTVNGVPVDTRAALAAEAGTAEALRRTTIIVLDVSNSMRGDRFTGAIEAAKGFLAQVPQDVYVGIVTFANEVAQVQSPTTNHDAASEVLEELSLSPNTRLYDGVLEAIAAAGSEGQRSLLVLSDGKDTSSTALGRVTQKIEQSGVAVNVVALEQSADALGALEVMSRAGGGTVVPADDPARLSELFAEQASALAHQILITAQVPQAADAREATVDVVVTVDGEQYSDSAFVALGGQPNTSPTNSSPDKRITAAGPSLAVSHELMLVGLAGAGLAVMTVLLFAFGVFGRREPGLEERISAYTSTGNYRPGSPQGRAPGVTTHGGPSKSVSASAVGMAEKALSGSKGFEATLHTRLEAAGLSFKPAEWLLMHAGISVGAGLLGFLLSAGGVLLTVVLLALGAILPWLYLSRKRSKRLKAFNAQLAETLQLISGSLSAGLSLAQSIDTVVREGAEPMAGEFRRALIEARLGVQIEDSLNSIAARMESPDFAWVVMAIRIQREVGGNLAELLLTVAATMRERDYLRRQVKTLSAEGRMSAWILCALPPGILLYLLILNPIYLEPMLSSPLGWIMLGTAATMMSVGAFWMSRLVKVEV